MSVAHSYATGYAFILGEPVGQGWTQMIEIVLALVLSSVIGLERELGQKSAGLRTHALVGVGAALFMLVSKYGFTDVLVPNKVVLDPSRVAAQIVTGIGFIGGGLIFVRRDLVRGLTTAAVVWLTAAVGAACGAGLPLLALVATAFHFVVVQGFPRVARRVRITRFTSSSMEIHYLDGRGLLRTILQRATLAGYLVSEIATSSPLQGDEGGDSSERVVVVTLQLQGPAAIEQLTAELSEIDGVRAVVAGEVEDTSE